MIGKYPTSWKRIDDIRSDGTFLESCEVLGDKVMRFFFFVNPCPQCKTPLRYVMNVYRRTTWSAEGEKYQTEWQQKTTGSYETHYCDNCGYAHTHYVGDW